MITAIVAAASTFVPFTVDDGCTCGPERYALAELGLFAPALGIALLALLVPPVPRPPPGPPLPVAILGARYRRSPHHPRPGWHRALRFARPLLVASLTILAVVVALVGLVANPLATLTHLTLAIVVFACWLARVIREAPAAPP